MSIVLLSFVLAAATINAQQNTGFSGFTQSYNPSTSIIQYTTSNAQGYFLAGDPIGLAAVNGSSLKVFAWYGALVYSGPATNLFLPVGHYFVEVPGDRNQFAVLPADWSVLSKVGWDSDYYPYPNITNLWTFLNLGWVRAVAAWDVIQAGGSNSWNWTRTDQIVNAHRGRRKIELNLEGVPSWIEDIPSATWKVTPNQFGQAFARFVQAVGQRYSNLVDIVEVWNEPNWTVLPTTNLTVQSDLLVSMLAAARAAFPLSVKISGGVFDSPYDASYAQLLAAAGGGQYMDYYAYHDYAQLNGPPDVPTARSPWTIPQRAQTNFAVFNKPLIVDEVGLFGMSALGTYTPPDVVGGFSHMDSGMSWTTGMIYAVKYAVMYAANDVIIMPHVILEGSDVADNHEWFGFDVHGRGPHPKSTAFLMSEYWLNAATLADWRSPGTNVYLYAWQRANNTSVVFAWAVDGKSFALSNTNAFSITDVYGRSIHPSVLDAQPVIFHTNSPNATALMNAVVAALPSLSNLRPIMGSLGNQTVLKDQLLQFAVPASDPNNYPLIYSASSLPSGATLNSTTGQFSWTPTASQLGTYSINFTVTNSRGLSASITTVIYVLGSTTDGLVNWWKFDEASGTTAADSSSANPGTLLSSNLGALSAWATGWTAGKIGNALSFDGVRNYVNLDSSKLSLSNNFTISTWINPRAAAAGYGVFFCLRSTYASSGFRFWVADNTLVIGGQTTTGWHMTYFAAGQIQNNTWSHILVDYDKSILEVYVNGVRVLPDYSGLDNWGGDFVMSPNGVSRIGAEFGGGPVGFFFNGLIDDVRAYNRTMTPDEVLALYQWRATVSPPRAPLNLTAGP